MNNLLETVNLESLLGLALMWFDCAWLQYKTLQLPRCLKKIDDVTKRFFANSFQKSSVDLNM